MSFNMPITVNGTIEPDSIDTRTPLEIRSVTELDSVRIELNSEGDLSAYECSACGEELNEADPRETLDGGATVCPDSDDERHQPQIVPLTWAKNISVDFDEDDDRIDLAIATGDPRGAWQMRLWRDHTTGKVMMSLPHANMSEPHEPIREIHPGTFEIG